MNSKEALQTLKLLMFERGEDVRDINKNLDLLDVIEKDLEILECFKKYFDFELAFEKNQTFLIFKSKERYLPVDEKISVANKYYEPLKRWLEK